MQFQRDPAICGRASPGRIRQVIETRGSFPTDEPATKLIWLALRTITAEWRRRTTGTRP